jgi:hypothetical protein
MKRQNLILVAVILMAAVSGATAQENGMKFGVHVGGNLSNMFGEVFGEGENPSWSPGFLAGVTFDAPITGPVYLYSALDIVQKGCKQEEEGAKLTASPLYGQLSLHAGTQFDAGFGKLLLHAGPYVAYGIGGKAKVSYNGESESIDIFGDNTDLKRLDYGIGVAAGLDFGRLALQLGYDLGLANIADSDDDSAKNGSVFLTVGYKF